MSSLPILLLWAVIVLAVCIVSIVTVNQKLNTYRTWLQAEIENAEKDLLDDLGEIEKAELEQTQEGRELLAILLREHPQVVKGLTAEHPSLNLVVASGNEEPQQVVYGKAPRIAVVGKVGVGKSTTVNKLFNPKPPIRVGHILGTAKKPESVLLKLDSAGDVIIVDFPGLGESIRADIRIVPMYKDLLPKCDIVLWILNADSRTFADDQRYIRDILTPKLRERLVIGVNQIDLIRPGVWSEEYNLPSPEQDISISQCIRNIKTLLRSIGIKPQSVIAYSAEREYHLTRLAAEMLKACPAEKALALRSSLQLEHTVYAVSKQS